MNAEGLLASWQKHHGALSPKHRELFLSRVEVAQIIEYLNAAIQYYLPYHPWLKRLLYRLRSDAQTALKRLHPYRLRNPQCETLGEKSTILQRAAELGR